MPEKVGDLVDRPALFDKLSRQIVAQKMGNSDATKLDPAAPQTVAHDPRHGRRVLDRPYGWDERQEQIRTIDLRSRPQDVVGERGAGLLEQRGHSVALALRVPDEDLAASPVDILDPTQMRQSPPTTISIASDSIGVADAVPAFSGSGAIVSGSSPEVDGGSADFTASLYRRRQLNT